MNTVILVPFRGDGARRDQLWQFTKEHFEHHHRYRIFEGASPDGPFNRAAAINDAAEKAGDWDLAVISDADTVTPPDQVDHAIDLAAITGRLVFAFTTVTELDEATTNQLLAGQLPDPPGVGKIRTDPFAVQSSCCVIPKTLWMKVGGMDDQFIGWGGEDNAFTHACTILGGEPLRVDGTTYHLWHPSPPKNDLDYERNLRRWQQYWRARTETDLAKLRA